MRKDQSPKLWSRKEKVKESTSGVGSELCAVFESDHVRVAIASKLAVEGFIGIDANENDILFTLVGAVFVGRNGTVSKSRWIWVGFPVDDKRKEQQSRASTM